MTGDQTGSPQPAVATALRSRLHTSVPFPHAVHAIAGHVLRQMSASLVTPLFQTAFLVALVVAVFLVARAYQTDVTSLALLWAFFPWVTAIFVPALAMQAFADTPGDRHMELLASLPVSSSQLAAGTWAAGFIVLLATLALTFPFPATMAYLGDLDGGAALSGYLGAAGHLGVAYAAALLASAATRSPIGGYVLGAIGLLTLQLLSNDTIAGLLRDTWAERFIASLPVLTPGYWLADMATGRIALAAMVYFVAAAVLLLIATAAFIERRRRTGAPIDRNAALHAALRASLAIAAAGLLFGLALRIDAGIDLTEESEFTLHPQTRAIAKAAQPGTRIDLYWSASNPDIPVAIRAHAARIARTIRQIAAHSGGNIEVVRHDPAPDTEAEDEAQLKGIQPVALSAGGHFMLGAAFTRGERQSAIAYFAPDRGPVLEYDVTSTLAALAREKTPRVGILSPLLAPRHTKEPREGLAILEEIKRQYDVAIIPHFADALPDGLDALVVIDATILKPEMLRAIDAHVMAGRGLIVMMDPFVRFNAASNAVLPEPGEEINDISDLLLRYGIRFNGTSVIGDASLASTVGAGNERFQYPFWMRVPRAELSRTHPAVAGLNELGFAEPGSLGLSPPAKPLVMTSPRAGELPRGEFKDANPQELGSRLKAGAGVRVLAAANEGAQQSAYRDSLNATGKRMSQEHVRVYAIADVDWIFDPLTYTGGGSGEGRTLQRPLNDNVTALSNLIEAATGQPGLAGIRSRARLARPFHRVGLMLAQAQARYREKEAELLQRISRVEDNVAKALEVSGARTLSELPASIQDKVSELRHALLPHRRELRALRKQMRQDVESLGWRLTVLNLLAAPALVLLLAAAMRWWARRSAMSAIGRGASGGSGPQ